MAWINNKQKSFKEQSEEALSIFNKTLNDLEQVNVEILKKENALDEAIKALQAEKNEINSIAKENGKIMSKIYDILTK